MMRLLREVWSRRAWPILGLLTLILLLGCDDNGNLTDTVETVSDRNLSGVAGPVDPDQLEPVARVPRDRFGTANTAAALAFPDLNGQETSAFEDGLDFFTTPHTADEGVGPVANQNRCLGCHTNTAENDLADGLVTFAVGTPAGRAARSAPTDFATSSQGNAPMETQAFTLFGDFSPASGSFDGLALLGGPVQHVRPLVSGCLPDVIPPPETTTGPVDPTTGVSATGLRRTVGERQGPPYIGRGLMEAVFADDILALEDPNDTEGHDSSLAPAAETNPECPGDCLSGRHNENRPPASLVGGDPVLRVSRLGLRAAGPTLLQFMIGGSNGELGFTSPFAPNDPFDPQNVDRGVNCDAAPDPELEEDTILNLRSMIRMVSLPELDQCLLGTSATCDTDGVTRDSIERGAQLFGVDLEALRSRLLAGMTPVGDFNAINQADRQLNCVGCHLPIVATGASPAETGARHLSHKWVPLWSDLLIHDMGAVTPERRAPELRDRFLRQEGTLNGTFDVSRSLADDAIPGQGVATGREWRTPPLMGLGRIGPPFLHDGRVYLSTSSPNLASTVFTSATAGTNAPLVVDSLDTALQAAIELHDLPPSDDDTTPADGGCPVPPGNRLGAIVYENGAEDICPPLNSSNRSEARNVMQRWRALTDDQQQDVINFLKAL
jgi:CxxC motif-containing protein (DUF1111 family)